MIRLRHKLLIHLLRLFDQMLLVATSVAIVYFRPDILLQRGSHVPQDTFRIEDTFSMAVVALGWIAIFECFIRYKADRLVALKTQLKNLIQATGIASIWLMIICALFAFKVFNIFNILVFFGVVTTIGIASRLLLRLILLSARRSGYNFRY